MADKIFRYVKTQVSRITQNNRRRINLWISPVKMKSWLKYNKYIIHKNENRDMLINMLFKRKFLKLLDLRMIDHVNDGRNVYNCT